MLTRDPKAAMSADETSEQDKLVRIAVVKVLRAVAMSWDRYPNNQFTGREVANGLRRAASNLETKLKKVTIIRP